MKKYKDAPFALIGVNSDDDLEMIRKVVREQKLTWRSFWNGPKGTQGPISTAWNVKGWPTIYLLDGQGRIRFRDPTSEKQIDEQIDLLLAELKQR